METFSRSVATGYCYTNEVAALHYNMGRFEQAIETYRRSLTLAASAVGGGSNERLLANNIGTPDPGYWR